MFLNKRVLQSSGRVLRAQERLIVPASRSFSVWDMVRDRFKPIRHLDSYFELDG